MITYKTGDVIAALLRGEIRTFIHQANCQNTMQSGIARQVRVDLPQLWQVDQKTIKGDIHKLGKCSYAIIDQNLGQTALGINLYGQFAYGLDTQHTDYDAIRSGLVMARAIVEAYGLDGMPIGMPKIGCGFGGGDWAVVSAIVHDTLGDLNINIYSLEV